MKSYCVKCRTKRQMMDAHEVKNKTGHYMLVGKCRVCGSKMYRFIKHK